VGNGDDDQGDEELGPVASLTSTTGRDLRRSMAFRSVVSVLLRELGDFSLHPQGRAGGRPEAARRAGNDTTVTGGPASPFRAGPRWPIRVRPDAPHRPVEHRKECFIASGG
jgi:hypothetical protein